MLQSLRSRWKTNSSAVHLRRLSERAAAMVAGGDRVLQIAPAEFLFPSSYAQARYESVDSARPGALQSFKIDGATEPYAMVVCTHAIEHAPDALALLNVLREKLKPGGILVLTAPLYYMEHQEPDDYARFTRAGLQRLLHAAGFEITEFGWLEGYCGTLAYSFRMAFEGLPLSPRCYGGGLVGLLGAIFANLIVRPTSALFATVLYHIDLRHKHTDSGCCKSYQIIARPKA